MKSLFGLLAFVVLCYNTTAEFHSGLYKITQGSRLEDTILKHQRTDGIMTCAHFCTMNPQCTSFNFKASRREDRGLCELNGKSADHKTPQRSPGWWFGQIVRQTPVISTPRVFSATFTNLGGKLYLGPTSTDGYQGTPLEGKVGLQNGTQVWGVPYTGLYSIEALGASGGNGTNATIDVGWRLGGRGAKIKGNFHLEADTRLKILVGQQGGIVDSLLQDRPGGGGGGTFVTTMEDTGLVIAGGGGGGASIFPSGDCRNGDPGQATENGTRHGGTKGNGGKRYDKINGEEPPLLEGTAGGGFYTDGSSTRISAGGQSFIHGGRGGKNGAGCAHGGFGGGGAGTMYPGGGGGYSGGGVVGDRRRFAAAGGGGSFNNGTEQENESGVNLGNGKVVIRLIK